MRHTAIRDAARSGSKSPLWINWHIHSGHTRRIDRQPVSEQPSIPRWILDNARIRKTLAARWISVTAVVSSAGPQSPQPCTEICSADIRISSAVAILDQNRTERKQQDLLPRQR